MVYIRGDTHGAISAFSGEMEDAAWTSTDTLLVAGDFGFMLGHSPATEREKLNKLAKKPYQILFCAGNHENYDWLCSLPEEERHGAPVRRVREHIFCLQNGYIYTIENKTFSSWAERPLSSKTGTSVLHWRPRAAPKPGFRRSCPLRRSIAGVKSFFVASIGV